VSIGHLTISGAKSCSHSHHHVHGLRAGSVERTAKSRHQRTIKIGLDNLTIAIKGVLSLQHFVSPTPASSAPLQ